MCSMHTDQEAFIREIAADPESDVPRLIYADWLEERGDPQGEFVRVQCELASLSVESDEIAELRAREAALMRQHRAAWVADVSAGIRWNSFCRGFVEQVILDGSPLLTEKCQALRRAPIRELGIVLRTPEQVAALADSPEFRQLRTLRLGGSPLGDKGIQRLVQSKHFPRLKALWLSNCGIGPTGAAALSSCEALSEVQRLVLLGNPLGEGGARLIDNSPVFRNARGLGC
jgi:uncharacterized protein (TIGR02996 family)